MKHYLRMAGLVALLLAILTTPLFAQDLGNQDHPGPWLPPSASDYAPRIDFLYTFIFWLTTGMFLLTEGLLILFCIMYRRRPGHKPTPTHGNNVAELTWTIIPALMLLGIAVWQIPAWNHIKRPDWAAMAKDSKTTVVDILGHQYKWGVRYPGSKKTYGGEHDFTGLSTVHIPFGNTALFNLRSKDVIHSVFIPMMRVKQDTVPGLRQRLWFKPNRFFLVDLKTPPDVDSKKWDGTKIKIQRIEWSTDEKDFAPGGKFFDKKVAVSAVSDYTQKDGLYDVYRPSTKEAPDKPGPPKQVRVLHQGKVVEKQDWAACDYALGIFEIACAELCGMGHYTMRGFLVVEPRASYEWWIKDETENAGNPKDDPANIWRYWVD